MIKVNLLKTRVGRAPKDGGFDESTLAASTYAGTTQMSSPGDEKAAVLNLVLMVAFIVPLYFYESQIQRDVKAELNTKQETASRLSQELTSKKAKESQTSQIQSEIKELEGKVSVLRKLTRIRVRELKALDHLQTIIPDRVWLRSIDYKDEKIRFEGFAVADDDLTEFIKALEARNVFTNVILLQATEAKTKEGTVRSFEVSANLETN